MNRSVSKAAKTSTTGKKAVAKPRQRRPEEVKARILTAALNAFATHGYEGTSTRLVAGEANVSISLLLYHFQSKEQLWRAAVDQLMPKVSIADMLQTEDLIEASAEAQLRAVIRTVVTVFAEKPALHRLMILEAHQPSERLTWLVENYVKEDYKTICNLIVAGQKDGTVRQANPARLRFAIVAMAAVPFSVAAEYQYLTRRNPFSPAEIENAVEFIDHLVFVED